MFVNLQDNRRLAPAIFCCRCVQRQLPQRTGGQVLYTRDPAILPTANAVVLLCLKTE